MFNITKRLFTIDPYMTEFNATIKDIGSNYIILDKTCFFPQSGGQVGDIGYLNEVEVIDTQYDEKKESIKHILKEKSDFKVDHEVHGKINWARRYSIMKLHSASHIMEYFLFEVFGKLNLMGNYVNEKHDSSTYEYNDTFSMEKLKQVEDSINEFILNNYDIECTRDMKIPDRYYWKSGGIIIPCGGTHPRNVKEIGPVSLKRKSGGKGKEKIFTSLKNDNP